MIWNISPESDPVKYDATLIACILPLICANFPAGTSLSQVENGAGRKPYYADDLILQAMAVSLSSSSVGAVRSYPARANQLLVDRILIKRC